MYSTEEFLERYKELEAWAVGIYGKDGVKGIEDSHHNKQIKTEASYFRHVRNIFAHNPNGIDKPLILLTGEFKTKFEAFCSNLTDSVSQFYVPYKDIYKREMSDKVMQTIKVMRDRSFTHVPIMNGKKVWGVFSDTTIFNLVGSGDTSMIQDNVQFFNISKYVAEYSDKGIYDFARGNVSADAVRRMFSDAFDEGRKLEVIFFTTTGDKNGDLIGLVTIWDLTSA